MTDHKDTNPKDALGIERAPISTVPMNVILELGTAMLEGARKYGRHNYRVAGVCHSVYIDAVFRHLAAHWEGETIDPDSGLPHVTKAMAALAVLRDSMYGENDHDDRPPSWDALVVKDANAQAKDTINRTPNPAEPYTQAGRQTEAEEAVMEAIHALPPEAFPGQGKTGREVFRSVAVDADAVPEFVTNRGL